MLFLWGPGLSGPGSRARRIFITRRGLWEGWRNLSGQEHWSCGGPCLWDPHGSSGPSVAPAQKDLTHSSALHRVHMRKTKTLKRHHLLAPRSVSKPVCAALVQRCEECQTHLTCYTQRIASVHPVSTPSSTPQPASPSGCFPAAAHKLRTTPHGPPNIPN